MIQLRDKRVFVLGNRDMTFTSPRVGDVAVVPDEALTIRQIMDRHVKGMNVADNMMRNGKYTDNGHDAPDEEELVRMDMVDRHEFAQELKRKNDADVMAVQAAIDNAKAKKAEAEANSQTAKADDGDSTKADAGGGGTTTTKERPGTAKSSGKAV